MKACLIVGPVAATTYPDTVKLFQEKEIRGGYTTIYYYDDDQGNTIRVGECFWYTTLMTNRSQMERRLELTKIYTPEEYPEYDDYPAIEVSRYADIPIDYEGLMGVPITVLEKNLDNVVIVGDEVIHNKDTKINGKERYRRVVIKKNYELIDHKEPALPIEVIRERGMNEYPSRQIYVDGKLCQKTYHRLLIKRDN